MMGGFSAECPICHKWFTTQGGLKEHTSKKHKPAPLPPGLYVVTTTSVRKVRNKPLLRITFETPSKEAFKMELKL